MTKDEFKENAPSIIIAFSLVILMIVCLWGFAESVVDTERKIDVRKNAELYILKTSSFPETYKTVFWNDVDYDSKTQTYSIRHSFMIKCKTGKVKTFDKVFYANKNCKILYCKNF